MWTAVVTIASAVLSAAIGVVNASHRSPLGRRIRYHSDLLKHVAADDGAVKALEALIAAEAEELRIREEERLRRVINPAGIALAIGLTGMFGIGFYYALQWVLIADPGWVRFIALVVAVLAGTAVLVIAFASYAAIWQERKP